VEAAVLSDPGLDEQARVLATLVSAFRRDPVERWLYPDDHQFEHHFPRFLAAFGGSAFELGTAWRLGDYAAVALWLPPEAEPDGQKIIGVLMDTVAAAKHADTLAALEHMDAAHPTYAHWYLPWFGVHAADQGQGLGSRLMTACLGVVDAAGLPAYLETPNPRTVSFYRRHGFTVAEVITAGACPPITLMTRPAHAT
jgi:ribosomal protein S18 acetylase RimI-like enzyme